MSQIDSDTQTAAASLAMQHEFQSRQKAPLYKKMSLQVISSHPGHNSLILDHQQQGSTNGFGVTQETEGGETELNMQSQRKLKESKDLKFVQAFAQQRMSSRDSNNHNLVKDAKSIKKDSIQISNTNTSNITNQINSQNRKALFNTNKVVVVEQSTQQTTVRNVSNASFEDRIRSPKQMSKTKQQHQMRVFKTGRVVRNIGNGIGDFEERQKSQEKMGGHTSFRQYSHPKFVNPPSQAKLKNQLRKTPDMMAHQMIQQSEEQELLFKADETLLTTATNNGQMVSPRRLLQGVDSSTAQLAAGELSQMSQISQLNMARNTNKNASILETTESRLLQQSIISNSKPQNSNRQEQQIIYYPNKSSKQHLSMYHSRRTPSIYQSNTKQQPPAGTGIIGNSNQLNSQYRHANQNQQRSSPHHRLLHNQILDGSSSIVKNKSVAGLFQRDVSRSNNLRFPMPLQNQQMRQQTLLMSPANLPEGVLLQRQDHPESNSMIAYEDTRRKDLLDHEQNHNEMDSETSEKHARLLVNFQQIVSHAKQDGQKFKDSGMQKGAVTQKRQNQRNQVAGIGGTTIVAPTTSIMGSSNQRIAEKTRNQLQNHVVNSQNPIEQAKKAVIGQPYVAALKFLPTQKDISSTTIHSQRIPQNNATKMLPQYPSVVQENSANLDDNKFSHGSQKRLLPLRGDRDQSMMSSSAQEINHPKPQKFAKTSFKQRKGLDLSKDKQIQIQGSSSNNLNGHNRSQYLHNKSNIVSPKQYKNSNQSNQASLRAIGRIQGVSEVVQEQHAHFRSQNLTLRAAEPHENSHANYLQREKFVGGIPKEKYSENKQNRLIMPAISKSNLNQAKFENKQESQKDFVKIRNTWKDPLQKIDPDTMVQGTMSSNKRSAIDLQSIEKRARRQKHRQLASISTLNHNQKALLAQQEESQSSRMFLKESDTFGRVPQKGIDRYETNFAIARAKNLRQQRNQSRLEDSQRSLEPIDMNDRSSNSFSGQPFDNIGNQRQQMVKNSSNSNITTEKQDKNAQLRAQILQKNRALHSKYTNLDKKIARGAIQNNHQVSQHSESRSILESKAKQSSVMLPQSLTQKSNFKNSQKDFSPHLQFIDSESASSQRRLAEQSLLHESLMQQISPRKLHEASLINQQRVGLNYRKRRSNRRQINNRGGGGNSSVERLLPYLQKTKMVSITNQNRKQSHMHSVQKTLVTEQDHFAFQNSVCQSSQSRISGSTKKQVMFGFDRESLELTSHSRKEGSLDENNRDLIMIPNMHGLDSQNFAKENSPNCVKKEQNSQNSSKKRSKMNRISGGGLHTTSKLREEGSSYRGEDKNSMKAALGGDVLSGKASNFSKHLCSQQNNQKSIQMGQQKMFERKSSLKKLHVTSLDSRADGQKTIKSTKSLNKGKRVTNFASLLDQESDGVNQKVLKRQNTLEDSIKSVRSICEEQSKTQTNDKRKGTPFSKKSRKSVKIATTVEEIDAKSVKTKSPKEEHIQNQKGSQEHNVAALSESNQTPNSQVGQFKIQIDKVRYNGFDEPDELLRKMTEHTQDIRIEIGKDEVIHEMETDLTQDLSLLYYDFNNSKARLLKKKKKSTDFVIQEEQEADLIGDGKENQMQQVVQIKGPVAKKRSAIKKKLKTNSSHNVVEQEPIIVSKDPREQLQRQNAAKSNLQQRQIQRDEDNFDLSSQKEFERIKEKAGKLRLSVNQLQQEGLNLTMGLQSPSKLLLSQKSLSQQTLNSEGIRDLQQNQEAQPQESPSQQYHQKILADKSAKKKVIFDTLGAQQNHFKNEESPFFGVENKQLTLLQNSSKAISEKKSGLNVQILGQISEDGSPVLKDENVEIELVRDENNSGSNDNENLQNQTPKNGSSLLTNNNIASNDRANLQDSNHLVEESPSAPAQNQQPSSLISVGGGDRLGAGTGATEFGNTFLTIGNNKHNQSPLMSGNTGSAGGRGETSQQFEMEAGTGIQIIQMAPNPPQQLTNTSSNDDRGGPTQRRSGIIDDQSRRVVDVDQNHDENENETDIVQNDENGPAQQIQIS